MACMQTIVEDPLMRHSAILVFANKQDLVRHWYISKDKIQQEETPVKEAVFQKQGRGFAAIDIQVSGTESWIAAITVCMPSINITLICRKGHCQQQRCAKRWACLN